MSRDLFITGTKPTLRRLPLYLRYLQTLAARGEETVTSAQLADEFGYDQTQVRKDLAVTGQSGTSRIGYRVNDLMTAIMKFLGWDRPNDAFLVGVGNLGSALLGYKNFRAVGFNIVAAFDTDPEKIGGRIHDVEVFAVERLEPLARRMHVAIGIITVPGETAQQIADTMVASGIIGIWNFAPVAVKVPENVAIENARLSTSLAVLTNKLSTLLQPRT